MKTNLKSKHTLTAAILIITAGFFSCGSIAPAEKIKKWADMGALIVDVRTPPEYAAGNIPGSVNIPLGDIESRIDEFGKKDGYIIVYCRSGNRSGKAKEFLESRGYRNVINGGGLKDMLKALE